MITALSIVVVCAGVYVIVSAVSAFLRWVFRVLGSDDEVEL